MEQAKYNKIKENFNNFLATRVAEYNDTERSEEDDAIVEKKKKNVFSIEEIIEIIESQIDGLKDMALETSNPQNAGEYEFAIEELNQILHIFLDDGGSF